jgi:hypothetical protein
MNSVEGKAKETQCSWKVLPIQQQSLNDVTSDVAKIIGTLDFED